MVYSDIVEAGGLGPLTMGLWLSGISGDQQLPWHPSAIVAILHRLTLIGAQAVLSSVE